MTILRAALAVLDRIAAAAAALAAVCLGLLALVILAQVFSVGLTRRSLTFSWEYGSFLMAAAFFLGLAYTLRTGGHVRVSLVSEHLPPRATWALDVAATALGLLVAGYVAYALVDLAYGSFVTGSRSFTATATPLYIPQTVIALGAVLLALQLAARLVRLAIGEPPDDLGRQTDLPSELG